MKMTHEQFCASGQRIYGKVGWKGQLAKRLGKRRETISRYANDKLDVPPSIELAMKALELDILGEREG